MTSTARAKATDRQPTNAERRLLRNAAIVEWWAAVEPAMKAAIALPQGLAWRPGHHPLTWFGGDPVNSTRAGVHMVMDPRPIPRDGEPRFGAEVRVYPPQEDGTRRAMLFCNLGNLAATGSWPASMLRGNRETFITAASPGELAEKVARTLAAAFQRAADAGEVRALMPAARAQTAA